MTVHHQAAVQELRDMHNITMATLHEEHARTMRGMISDQNMKCNTTASVVTIIIMVVVVVVVLDLRKAHEQQKLLLEEDFEKLRLSLQVFHHSPFYFLHFSLTDLGTYIIALARFGRIR